MSDLISFEDFTKGTPTSQAAPAPASASASPADGSAPAPTQPTGGLMSYDDFLNAKPPEPATPPATTERMATQALAGGSRAGYGLLGLPVDAAKWTINQLYDAATHNPLNPTEHHTLIDGDPVGGSGWMMANAPGTDARTVVPVTPQDRVAAGVGAGVTGILLPGAMARGLTAAAGEALPAGARAATDAIGSGFSKTGAAAGGVGGVTGAAAAETVPEPYKPLAEFAGNLIGGGATALIGAGADAALTTAGRLARDYTAPLTQAGRERLAGQKIIGDATDPGAARAAITDTPPEEQQIVPGSTPTTAQLANNDPGLVNLQRVSERVNPQAFEGVKQQQNAARVGSLNSIAPDATPSDVGDFFRQKLQDIADMGDSAVKSAQQRGQGLVSDAQTEAASKVGAAQDATQQAVQDLGGSLSPDQYGAALRDNELSPAKAATKAAESRLWQAIDPDGTLALDIQPVRKAANEIRSSIPENAAPPSGEEASIISQAQMQPKVQSFTEVQALRSRLLDAIRNERFQNGDTPALRRMTQLRSALDGAIATAAERQAQVDPGVLDRLIQGGHITQGVGSDFAGLLPSQGTDGTTASLTGTAGRQDASAAGRVAGDGLGVGRVDPVVAQDGSAGQAGGGSRSLAGGAQAPSSQVLTPTWDADAASRYQAARAATADRKQTFNAGPVDQVLRAGKQGQIYNLPDEQVAGRFFNSGPQALANSEAFIRAVGNRPSAVNLLQDYAASDLRRAAVTDDGTLDLRKFGNWQMRHIQALRSFPELAERFQNAAAAQETLNNALAKAQSVSDMAAAQAKEGVQTAEASAALAKKVYQKSVAGEFMKTQDPVEAVGSILNGKNSSARMAQAASKVSDNPDAAEGFRRATAEYLLRRFANGAKAGDTGTNYIDAASLRRYVNANRGALSFGLGPDGLKTVDAVVSDLERANPALGKGGAGSDTQQNIVQHGKATKDQSLMGRMISDMGHGLPLFALFEHAGWGAAVGTAIIGGLRKAGIESTTDLVAEAMANPALAKILIEKVPARPTPMAGKSLLSRLSAVASASAGQSQGYPSAP